MYQHNFPSPQGLYDPMQEKDACGVAMVATMRGYAGHDIIDHALLALANLDHRGATGADPLVAGYARGAEQIGVDDLVATGHRTRSALLRDAARLLAERTGAPSWRAGWAELLVTSGDAELARTGSAVFRELVDDGHAGALTGRQCLLHAHTLLARQTEAGEGAAVLAAQLPRLTALKLLNVDLFTDNEIRKRFEREADIAARWLFGAPAADLPVEGELRLTPARALPGFDGFQFGRHDDDASPEIVAMPSGTTDAEGRFAARVDLPASLAASARPYEAALTLTLREGAGRPVERTDTRLVLPARPAPGAGAARVTFVPTTA